MGEEALVNLLGNNGLAAASLFILYKMSGTLKDVVVALDHIKQLEARLEKLEKEVTELRFLLRKENQS